MGDHEARTDATATRPPFPFLLGCRRSGTTLTRVMFDCNPELAIPLEIYFSIDTPADWSDPSGALVPERAVGRMKTMKWFRRTRLDSDAWLAAALAGSVTTYPDLIRCLYRLYADSQGKPRYGNKTPRHVIYIPTLARMFPEGRFVHIIRDGRDVAMSILDRDPDVPDMAAAARLWKDRVEHGRKAGAVLGPERYREMRYEDLLEDTEGVLRSLCVFLELPFDEAMLRYYEQIPEMVMGTGEHVKLSQPPTKGFRDWRGQMAKPDVVLFESIAGSTLRECGYEVSLAAPPPRERIRARATNGSSRVRVGVRALRELGGSVKRRIWHA